MYLTIDNLMIATQSVKVDAQVRRQIIWTIISAGATATPFGGCRFVNCLIYSPGPGLRGRLY
jgi:hypothetical protein